MVKLQQFSSREEIIWASGLFEGEGWISIQGFCPSIGIQMCDKDVLERFAKAVGGGPIYYRKPRIYNYEKIKSRKEQWAWRVTGFQNVQAVTAYLWNWLGKRRRDRIKEVLEISCRGCVKPGMQNGTKLQKSIAKHGDVRKYWQGCRCNPCTISTREYKKKNNAKTKHLRATYTRHNEEISV